MPSKDDPLPPFDGWETPRYTPIPDQLFDEWLPHLSEAELKVLLYIMRRTFGFKKNADAISLSQLREGIMRRDGTRLDKGIGMAESTIIRGIKGLVGKGLIDRVARSSPTAGDQPTVYRLRLQGSSTMTEGALHDARRGDSNSLVTRLASQETQETPVQEYSEQESTSLTDQADALPPHLAAARASIVAPPAAAVQAGTAPSRATGPEERRR